MFTKKSESLRIVEKIAEHLNTRYYDVEIIDLEDEAFISAHYDVTGAEQNWQNGQRTRYIHVWAGAVVADVDDYIESEEQARFFDIVEKAYGDLKEELWLREKAELEMEQAAEDPYYGMPLDDDEIPF